jgi:hypothetical protein
VFKNSGTGQKPLARVTRYWLKRRFRYSGCFVAYSSPALVFRLVADPGEVAVARLVPCKRPLPDSGGGFAASVYLPLIAAGRPFSRARKSHRTPRGIPKPKFRYIMRDSLDWMIARDEVPGLG